MPSEAGYPRGNAAPGETAPHGDQVLGGVNHGVVPAVAGRDTAFRSRGGQGFCAVGDRGVGWGTAVAPLQRIGVYTPPRSWSSKGGRRAEE